MCYMIMVIKLNRMITGMCVCGCSAMRYFDVKLYLYAVYILKALFTGCKCKLH